jgi:hypothetical protein
MLLLKPKWYVDMQWCMLDAYPRNFTFPVLFVFSEQLPTLTLQPG